MNNSDYTNKIEKYLNEEMGEEEKRNFEKQLEENPELNKAYELHFAMNETLEVLSFRNELNEIKLRRDAKSQLNRPSKWKWVYRVAAAVMIPMFFAFFYANMNYTTANLVKKNYTVPDYSKYRNESGQQSDVAIAAQLFHKKEFNNAEELLEKILSTDQPNSEAQFILASVYYEKGELTKSKEMFHSVSSFNNKRHDRAEWNLALINLELENPVVALKLLTNIKNNKQHYFNEEASILFDKLKSKWRILVFK